MSNSKFRSLVALAPLALAMCLVACQSNAEKLQAYCTDFKAAAEDNQHDCDKMGEELEAVIRKHDGLKTYGNPDDEASQSALDDCEAGGRIIAARCSGNETVNEALSSIEAR